MYAEISWQNATLSIEKLFVNIPQLKSEKDWLVWNFQAMHALKAADIRGYVIDYSRTRRRSQAESILLHSAVHWANYVPMVIGCKSPKQMWNTLCQLILRKEDSQQQSIYADSVLWAAHEERGSNSRPSAQARQTSKSIRALRLCEHTEVASTCQKSSVSDEKSRNKGRVHSCLLAAINPGLV